MRLFLSLALVAAITLNHGVAAGRQDGGGGMSKFLCAAVPANTPVCDMKQNSVITCGASDSSGSTGTPCAAGTTCQNGACVPGAAPDPTAAPNSDGVARMCAAVPANTVICDWKRSGLITCSATATSSTPVQACGAGMMCQNGACVTGTPPTDGDHDHDGGHGGDMLGHICSLIPAGTPICNMKQNGFVSCSPTTTSNSTVTPCDTGMTCVNGACSATPATSATPGTT